MIFKTIKLKTHLEQLYYRVTHLVHDSTETKACTFNFKFN